MKEKIKLKYFYFFVMVNVAGEPVTDAMRFKYFLVDVWDDAKAGLYDIEEKAKTKVKNITAILSQKHNVHYEVANIEKITNAEFTVLKKHFAHYNEDARAYDTADNTDDEDEVEEKEA